MGCLVSCDCLSPIRASDYLEGGLRFVWNENAGLIKRLMKIHSNPLLLYDFKIHFNSVNIGLFINQTVFIAAMCL